MALVVVGRGPGAVGRDRQPPLAAIERLDLALLVHAEDNGVGGRIDIKTDHVAELLQKARVFRELEGPHPVRREDTLYRCAGR